MHECIAVELAQLHNRIQQLEAAQCKRKKWNLRSQQRHLNRALKQFAETVQIGGVKDIAQVKHPMVRLAWIAVFIMCVLLTAYYVYRIVHVYISEPTATKVEQLHMDQYGYPEMLLCPDTWLDLEKALRSGLSLEGLEYALGYMINFYMRAPEFCIRNYFRAKRDFERWFAKSNFSNLVEAFKSFAQDSEQFIYKCPHCSSRSFKKVFMNEAICYSVPINQTERKWAARGTLDLLEVKIADKSGGLLQRRKYWRFVINADTSIGVSTTHFVQIFPGFSNTIGFTPMYFVNRNRKGRPCVDQTHNSSYSQAACGLRCARRFLNCTHMGYAPVADMTKNLSSLCHFYPPILWYMLEFINRDQDFTHYLPEVCADECPTLCQRWWYEVQVQSHPISTASPDAVAAEDQGNNCSRGAKASAPLRILNRLVGRENFTETENLTGSEAEDNNASLTRIYFLNQAMLQGGIISFIEINTYSLETLISNVGGVLGLCLGASIMSFVQLIMFFLTCCVSEPIKKRRETQRMRRRARKREQFVEPKDLIGPL